MIVRPRSAREWVDEALTVSAFVGGMLLAAAVREVVALLLRSDETRV